jgi:hypothetical protein
MRKPVYKIVILLSVYFSSFNAFSNNYDSTLQVIETRKGFQFFIKNKPVVVDSIEARLIKRIVFGYTITELPDEVLSFIYVNDIIINNAKDPDILFKIFKNFEELKVLKFNCKGNLDIANLDIASMCPKLIFLDISARCITNLPEKFDGNKLKVLYLSGIKSNIWEMNKDIEKVSLIGEVHNVDFFNTDLDYLSLKYFEFRQKKGPEIDFLKIPESTEVLSIDKISSSGVCQVSDLLRLKMLQEIYILQQPSHKCLLHLNQLPNLKKVGIIRLFLFRINKTIIHSDQLNFKVEYL